VLFTRTDSSWSLVNIHFISQPRYYSTSIRSLLQFTKQNTISIPPLQEPGSYLDSLLVFVLRQKHGGYGAVGDS